MRVLFDNGTPRGVAAAGSLTLPRLWPLPNPVVCPRQTSLIYDAEVAVELASIRALLRQSRGQ